MRVEEKLWSGIRVKKNSMSIFYVVLSTCCVGLADLSCHLVYLFCRLAQPRTQFALSELPAEAWNRQV